MSTYIRLILIHIKGCLVSHDCQLSDRGGVEGGGAGDGECEGEAVKGFSARGLR